MSCSVRSAKQKGNAFEYDCQASLQPLFKDIYRTSERGFQQQYDLRTDKYKWVFECKRLKGISWNQCVKFYLKLKERTPEGYTCALLFKSNNQPTLVFYEPNLAYMIRDFDKTFNVPFIKHESTRKAKR